MMKFALCNEMFRDLPLGEAFAKIAELGYQGVEVAPFTLRDNPLQIDESDADRCREAAEAAGLEIVGLHWLMAETEGLHLTHPEPEIRARTTAYLGRLAVLTARMRGTIMVLGSPQQRNLLPGTLYEDAFARAVEIIREVSEVAGEHGVTLAVEPLSPVETSFLSSCAEARRLLTAVNRPACRLHLDIKAMAHEPAGPVATIHEHRWEVAHFHANDVNQRGPGQGPTDLRAVAAALRAIEYRGWISVEPFDYHPSAEDCARISLENLRAAFGEG
jgi:sugar phosphate isomerase/epimerase